MQEKRDNYFYTQDLSVGYQKNPLIEGINFVLNRGEILVLIGPNGSGKSTILKSITNYLKPVRGVAYLDKQIVQRMSNLEFAKKTAIVFTERLKTELLTCEDVVSAGRYPYTGSLGILSRQDRKKVQEAMELVKIWELRDRDFTKISDGQRQRVLLARAICQEPEMIVLDEPTSFLDIRYQLELLEILRKLAKEQHMAILLSLHELDMAQKVADYVLCVKGKEIFRFGKPEEVFQEDVIRTLYNLDEGCYNPLFGNLEMARVMGRPQVFVIAGGGTGITTYRRLQKEKIPFATGVLHENDVDYQVAKALAVEVISECSFEKISEEKFQKAKKVMLECDRVINCLEGYGAMNQRNKDLWDIVSKR
ncbi:MAG: ABC transporter ATP-binding protein [Lachnospiraceae bacterium]